MQTPVRRLIAVPAAAALARAGLAAPGDASDTGTQQHVTYNAVYVVNGGDGENGSISVINADTGRVPATFALPGAMWPHHIYLSPDRSRLAVAVPGMDLSEGHGEPPPGDTPGEVIVLDARTGAIINRTTLPMMNHNAVYSADGREIWTSQMTMPGMVLVLDAATSQTKAEIEVGDMPAEVTLSPDGRFFYVANGMSNSVTVINAATKQIVKTVAVGENPVGVWQASNGFAYVDNETSMTGSALKRSTNTVTATFELGFVPGMARLGPDGHLWVTDADNGRVVLYSLDTVQRHTITVGDGAHGIAFSATGKTAYVTNQMAGTVSVINVVTRRVVTTLTVGTKPNGLVFRPLG